MANHSPQAQRKEPESLEERELKNKSSEALKNTLEEFKERGNDMKLIVKEYIQEKPFKSLGIAMLTGMALALILRR
jgi:ElaB/YqjD/DUF883 family membrane-anchored ribosome-binding protein